jgi:tRNA(adenine34) deaminase
VATHLRHQTTALDLFEYLVSGKALSCYSPRMDPTFEFHLFCMRSALAQARQALAVDEVPVGAVVALEGKIIGRGHNRSLRQSDPTAHAEILALRHAAKKVGNYRLTSATLYCTLEPCAMCAGALGIARIGLLVYGAKDSKAGVVDSHLNLLRAGFVNHRVEVISGILEKESSELLKEFFLLKR